MSEKNNIEIVNKVIMAGIKAPSGENCQPWSFKVVSDNKVELYNLPERDSSLYNINQFGSYIAHGALLENMVIAASSMGYRLDFTILPNILEAPNLIAEIIFTEANVTKDLLVNQIEDRCTNRKVFKNIPITDEQKKSLLTVAEQFKGLEFFFTTEKEKIISIASAASVTELIMLENEQLHDFFFNHINWTKEEEDDKKMGFYLETLELSESDKKGFKLASNWSALKILNVLGISKKVAKKNANIYSTASGMGAISIKGKQPIDFINAGRLLERIWLTATKLGLSVQPMTGFLFLKLGVDLGSAKALSKKHVMLIDKSYKEVQNSFGTKDSLVMLFRVGFSDQPTARASRILRVIQ